MTTSCALPSQLDLFERSTEPVRQVVRTRPPAPKAEMRASHSDTQRESLLLMRARMLETLTNERVLPQSMHLIMCDPGRARSYRVILSLDLFGRIVLDRHWGSLVSRRGNNKPMSFAPHQRDLARRLLLRILATRKRHGYELVAMAGG